MRMTAWASYLSHMLSEACFIILNKLQQTYLQINILDGIFKK